MLIATIPAATSYTDTAVVRNRVYYYTVTGVDSSGRETLGCPYAGAKAKWATCNPLSSVRLASDDCAEAGRRRSPQDSSAPFA